MVGPAAKREAVAHLQTVMGLSERRACSIACADRKMVRYRSVRPPDGELRGRLRDLANDRRRFGYRRLFVLLRREGERSGINRVYRLYREEGLTVRKRRARRRAVGTRAPILVEARANARWSLDFVHDQFACGRRFRALNIVDDVTRECLAAIPDMSISGRRVARERPTRSAGVASRALSSLTNARIVVIDSLTGYLNAMSEEQHLVLQMHEILTYLNQKGVVTILLLANHGLIGQMVAPVDMTYLCDLVMLLRFFESGGRLRRAISVVKKRVGPHEETIREFRIGGSGLVVGEPLEEFRGILTGVPSFEGKQGDLLNDKGS